MSKRKDFRKRFLVTEGELFKLYKEVQQVRKEEEREQFMADFRQLLKDAQTVKLVVEPKNETL